MRYKYIYIYILYVCKHYPPRVSVTVRGMWSI
jgi:hypothetical protein